MITLRSTGSFVISPSVNKLRYSSIVSGSFYVAYLLEERMLEMIGELGSLNKMSILSIDALILSIYLSDPAPAPESFVALTVFS